MIDEMFIIWSLEGTLVLT